MASRLQEKYNNQEYKHKGLQDIWRDNGRHIEKENRRR